MEDNEKHKLFKKRWDKYRKMGALKYGIFLGSLYALTLFSVSVLYSFNEGDLPLSEILAYIDGKLILKTAFFFVFGLVFGIYHYRKSEKKYKADNF